MVRRRVIRVAPKGEPVVDDPEGEGRWRLGSALRLVKGEEDEEGMSDWVRRRRRAGRGEGEGEERRVDALGPGLVNVGVEGTRCEGREEDERVKGGDGDVVDDSARLEVRYNIVQDLPEPIHRTLAQVTTLLSTDAPSTRQPRRVLPGRASRSPPSCTAIASATHL